MPLTFPAMTTLDIVLAAVLLILLVIGLFVPQDDYEDWRNGGDPPHWVPPA